MLRKLLGGLAATGLLAGFVGLATPAPAGASHAAAVAVFLSDANVGAPGLCLPGLNPLANCAPANVDPPNVTYSFSSPGGGVTLPGGVGSLPGVCQAAGVIGTSPAAGACNFTINGNVTGVAAPVGPTCGASHGFGGTGTFGGAISGTLSQVGWITSAGGTIPANGKITVGGHAHDLVSLVQARPLEPGACVLQPARTFTVLGVSVVLPTNVIPGHTS